MRAKSEIERQLEHFKSGKCGQHDSPTNQVWIEALEWVLGDPAHRAVYDDSIRILTETANDTYEGPRTAKHVRIMLGLILERIR